jgi:hypothetical protein
MERCQEHVDSSRKAPAALGNRLWRSWLDAAATAAFFRSIANRWNRRQSRAVSGTGVDTVGADDSARCADTAELAVQSGGRVKRGAPRLNHRPYVDRFAVRLSLRSLENRWAFDLGLPGATTSITMENGNLVIADIQAGGRDDNLAISADTTQSTRSYDFYRIEDPDAFFYVSDVPDAVVSDDGHVVEIPFLAIKDGRIVVRTEGGNNQLSLDFSTSTFGHDVEFDGGAEITTTRSGEAILEPVDATSLISTSLDRLRLTGGGQFDLVSHQATGMEAGVVRIDSLPAILYEQVESIDDGLASLSREFQFGTTDDYATLTSGEQSERNLLAVDQWTRIEFSHPDDSLTIHGADGDDRVTIGSLDANYRASLSVIGDDGEDVVVLSGNVSLGSLSSSGDLYVSAESIDLAGAIVTSGGAVEFVGWTRLSGDLSIDTRAADDGSGSVPGGDIRFADILESAEPGAFQLTLDAGVGDIYFADVVGQWNPLHRLEIGSARDVEFTGAIWLTGDFVQTGGSGATTLRGTSGNGIGGSLQLTTSSIRLLDQPVMVVGDATLTALESITIESPLDTTQGPKAYSAPGRIELRSEGMIRLAEDGDLLAAANILQAGDAAIVYTAAEMVTLTGGIELEGRVILTGNVTLDVTSSPQGFIQFHQSIDSGTWPVDDTVPSSGGGGIEGGEGDTGEDDAGAGGGGGEGGDEGGDAATGWWLTILSASGDVEFGGPVGAESPLGRIELLDARDVTFRGTVRTTGDVVQVRGVGTTELHGTSGEAAAGEGIGGQLSLETVAVRGMEASVFAAGGVVLIVSRRIYLDAPAGLDAGESTIWIEVGASGLAAEEDAFYGAGSTVRTASEADDAVRLKVANGGSATLGLLAAGTATGVVTVEVGGRILNGMSPEEPNIVASHASLRAGAGIGGIGFHDTGSVAGPLVNPLTGLPAPPLAIQVATINAQTTAGDIGLSETDDVELTGILATQGRIEIEARGGRISIRDGTFLRSATGIVSNAPPIYVFTEQNPEDVLLPADPTQEIVGTIGGDAVVDLSAPQFEVGRNFTLIVDWPDGQRGVLRGLVAGDEVVWRVGPNNEGQPQVRHGAAPEGQIRFFLQRTYSLLYLQGVADTEIVTQLTVVNDEGIRLYDQSGVNLNESDPPPTVATSISEDEFRGAGVVPVERGFSVVVETESVSVVETVSATVFQQTRYEDVSFVEEKAESDDAILVLTRVGVDGREEGETQIPASELKDLSGLLNKVRRAPLRNGLYRLYHQEPGLPRRKVLEFRKTAEGIGDPVREPGRGSNPREDQPSTTPGDVSPGAEKPGNATPGGAMPKAAEPGNATQSSMSGMDDRSMAGLWAATLSKLTSRGFEPFEAVSDSTSTKRVKLIGAESVSGHVVSNDNASMDNNSSDIHSIDAALAAADAMSMRMAARWRRGGVRGIGEGR